MLEADENNKLLVCAVLAATALAADGFFPQSAPQRTCVTREPGRRFGA